MCVCACLAAIAAPGAALACTMDARTIRLAPGEHVGGTESGFRALGLRDHEVVLTFDDGPTPETTPQILDILKASCTPATFFMLGEAAMQNPALVKRVFAEGHGVGGHSWSHNDLSVMTLGQAARDVSEGLRPVATSGRRVTLFRFPHLKSTPQLLNWLEGAGLTAIGVDIDPWDWAGEPPQQTMARLTQQLAAKGRGVILLHDNQPNTAKLLPVLLDFLRREGYSVVRLTGAADDRQLAGR